MNSTQHNFIVDLRANEQGGSSAIKNSRVCYFMPAWMRDGYETQAHADLDRRGFAYWSMVIDQQVTHLLDRARAAVALHTSRTVKS